MGLITYTRRLNDTRSIGWQFQEGQLRLFVLVQDRGLTGKGDGARPGPGRGRRGRVRRLRRLRLRRDVLGDRLQPKSFEPGVWQRFAPDFVYRYRKVDEETSTRQLAEALAELTAYVDAWEAPRF